MEENVKIDEKALSEEFANLILDFKKMRGEIREFGTYKAKVLENFNVSVSCEDGIEIVYPVMSSPWTVIMSWMIRWDEDSISSINNFFDYIAMPVVSTIVNADDQYINDIVQSQVSLKDRNGLSGIVEENKDDAYYISRDVFLKLVQTNNG